LQVSEPVVEDTSSFLSDALDQIDLSDPAAVSSSVVIALSVMNAPPPSSSSTVNLLTPSSLDCKRFFSIPNKLTRGEGYVFGHK